MNIMDHKVSKDTVEFVHYSKDERSNTEYRAIDTT